jgi:hypothetical protein
MTTAQVYLFIAVIEAVTLGTIWATVRVLWRALVPGSRQHPFRQKRGGATSKTLVGLLVVLVIVTGSWALARCSKDCRRFLKNELKSCKADCTKGRAGKACRTACSDEKKAHTAACKGAQNPTPPSCGALPCGYTGFPSCGGTCPPGEMCQASRTPTFGADPCIPGTSEFCVCVAITITCGDAACTAFGSCPLHQICERFWSGCPSFNCSGASCQTM